MYGKHLINRLKRFSSYGKISLRTIPASLRLVSLMSLLMVSIVTFYSIGQIHQLERSTEDLLLTAIPLKESTHMLETHLRKTEFLLHKFLVLNDPSYLSATEKEIAKTKVILRDLQPLLANAPEALSALQLLQTDLQKYWNSIDQLKNHDSDAAPISLEGVVDIEMVDFHRSINVLAVNRAATTIESADHVTNLLLLLVIGTAITGIFVSYLYTAAAIRPMHSIRLALQRIGDGHFEQNLDLEGLKELRELSHAINNMQVKLRKLENAKSEFLSMTSHELKTPLASFQSGIGLLLSGNVGELPESQRKIVEIMHKQTILLDSSIQEMLDMQAIQAQRMVMDIRPCNLTSIIHDAIEQISPLVAAKNQLIQWHALPFNDEVFVDRERTQQVLLNLLSNAKKYSPKDSKITVSTSHDDHYAEIVIEDQGPGIPEQYLGHACDKFFQVPRKGAHLRGTGLGLAIVKEIVEIQQGSVELENREHGGLRVRVRLPLHLMHHRSTPLQLPVSSPTT